MGKGRASGTLKATYRIHVIYHRVTWYDIWQKTYRTGIVIYHVPFFSPHTSECTLKLVGDSELGPIPNRQHHVEYPRYWAPEYQARIQDSTKGGGPRVQTMMYWSPPHSKGAKSPDPLVPPSLNMALINTCIICLCTRYLHFYSSYHSAFWPVLWGVIKK